MATQAFLPVWGSLMLAPIRMKFIYFSTCVGETSPIYPVHSNMELAITLNIDEKLQMVHFLAADHLFLQYFVIIIFIITGKRLCQNKWTSYWNTIWRHINCQTAHTLWRQWIVGAHFGVYNLLFCKYGYSWTCPEISSLLTALALYSRQGHDRSLCNNYSSRGIG